MFDEIKNWIVYEGGVCPSDGNHFGGDPNANPKLDLKIQQRPSELALVIEFLLQRKNLGECLDYYAEIGACSGGTTRAISNFLNFKELLIIDDGGGDNQSYINERDDQIRGQNLGTLPRVEIIGSSSEKRVIDHVLNISNLHLYDILFIDGDHSYEGVKSDTINYISIVRDGGYIIFHDTRSMESIPRWLSEINDVFPNLELVKDIGEPDEYTNYYPDGIGLKIYRKKYENI